MYLSSSVVSMTHKYCYENRGKRHKSRIVRDRRVKLLLDNNIILNLNLKCHSYVTCTVFNRILRRHLIYLIYPIPYSSLSFLLAHT